MQVHLIDGTYELFRHFFALPSSTDIDGQEIAATSGVLNSVLGMLRDGVTHIGVATDHVIESFRNNMYPGYKTGAGIDPKLRSQFPILEEALQSMGVRVWPMVEYEADDGLASAAHAAADDERVERILICTPDKDLSQCVRNDFIVQFDRRQGVIRNASGVVEKFGVPPESIPDYLGLVGDHADGFPGISGWGAKSSATVLAHYGHLEDIPKEASQWKVKVRGAQKLAATLQHSFAEALLFRELAQLKYDFHAFDDVEELRWKGPRASFAACCRRLGLEKLQARVELEAGRR